MQPDCSCAVPNPVATSSSSLQLVCRYAELLELAKARHVIVPPAYRIDEDEALARTVAAGAFTARSDLVRTSVAVELDTGAACQWTGPA